MSRRNIVEQVRQLSINVNETKRVDQTEINFDVVVFILVNASTIIEASFLQVQRGGPPLITMDEEIAVSSKLI